MGHGERVEKADVVGETPNIAARLQAIATPGSVAISATTHALIRGYFNCDALGFQALKGLEQPLEVFQVLNETGIDNRLDVASSLTPLIGRDRELETLLHILEKARGGRTQGLVLSGEAGIGKTRLVRVLQETLDPGAHSRVELRCSEFRQNSALFPIIDYLRHFLGLTEDDAPESALNKLKLALADKGLVDDDHHLPLLARLLSISLGAETALPPMNPERLKQQTFATLQAWLYALSTQRPVLFVVEDLHWIDPSTLELLSLILEREGQEPILVLMTARPDFVPPWSPGADLSFLSVGRLNREQVREVIRGVAGGRTLPEEITDQVVARTDGVPLFVEELTRMIIESGLVEERGAGYVLTGPLPAQAIPATLSESLTARLDRLGSAKTVAQLAACVGREFSYELLATVSTSEEPELQANLSRLVTSGLVLQRGEPPSARYVFKHALIQNTAYQSLLRSHRQLYHRQIARSLVERFPDLVESQPEMVAQHYTSAGLPLNAAPFWQRAGELALARSADREAVAQLEQGLRCIRSLTAGEDRDWLEMSAQIALGTAYRVAEGYTSTHGADASARARELCYQLGTTKDLLSTLSGLWAQEIMVARVDRAWELAAESLQVAEASDDPGLSVQAFRLSASTMFYKGQFEECLAYARRGMDLYDPTRDSLRVVQFQFDGLSACLSYFGTAACYSGHLDQAAAAALRAVQNARDVNHRHTLAASLMFATGIHYLCGDLERAIATGEEGTRLCIEHGFPQWIPWTQIPYLHALAKKGRATDCLARIDEQLANWAALGSRLMTPWFLGIKAELLLDVRRDVEAADAIRSGLLLAEETGQCAFEADLHRLLGEALLLSEPFEAEKEMRCALQLARRQNGRAPELRAAASLSELWHSTGKTAEARQLLAAAYAGFTEGRDSRGLLEARALLDTLDQFKE